MAFFFELDRGCCGCSVRSTVYIALLHYMLHGLFVVSFVFSNSCYPPFYYPDFMFGGAGAALLIFSFLTTFVANTENLQWLRCTFGFLLTVIVGLTVISTYMYTFERWNDVISTAITRSLRKPLERDFPDYFWYTLVILSCIVCSVLLIYLIYIMSYMCNKYNTPLLSAEYNIFQSGGVPPSGSTGVSIPPDTYSSKTYKPYPTQSPNNK